MPLSSSTFPVSTTDTEPRRADVIISFRTNVPGPAMHVRDTGAMGTPVERKK
jgi:hypothetical protein